MCFKVVFPIQDMGLKASGWLHHPVAKSYQTTSVRQPWLKGFYKNVENEQLIDNPATNSFPNSFTSISA